MSDEVVTVGFKLKPDLLEKVDNAAENIGIGRSTFIRMALVEKLATFSLAVSPGRQAGNPSSTRGRKTRGRSR